ncbi:13140_t:CDS:2, partial [Dentiscutata heterogama]
RDRHTLSPDHIRLGWKEYRKDKINSIQEPFKLKTSNRIEKQQPLLDKTNSLLVSKGPMAIEDSQAEATNLLQQSSTINDRPS